MERKKICIIKIGALGDVLRTTPILRILDGDIFWITDKKAVPLLLNNTLIKKVLVLNKIPKNYLKINFDLVVNLEESSEACQIASILNTKKYLGVFYNKNINKFDYTEESAGWFDMSLVSKLGKLRADRLKKKNIHTYQYFLFKMFGKKFKNEPYILNYKNSNLGIIGLEPRVGDVWPNKAWDKFNELKQELEKHSYKTMVLKQRKTLSAYINDISKCSLIVSGDTLAMHIGLALNKKGIAFFGPTSASEICDYGLLTKIITPLKCYCCYKRQCKHIPTCLEMVKVKTVFKKILASA